MLRVATFNIHHGAGSDGSVDLSRTAKAILQTDAEVVALQELDCGLKRSDFVDQPQRLAELTGLTVEFFPTLRRGRGTYGVAIAARGDVRPRMERLPQLSREEPRAVIVGRWRDVTVAAVHLARKREDPEGLQVRALARLASDLDPPVVILGDLNREPSSLGPLEAAGFEAGRERNETFGTLRRRQIDYVLAGPGLRISRSWTVASEASDHVPLVAEVERREPW